MIGKKTLCDCKVAEVATNPDLRAYARAFDEAARAGRATDAQMQEAIDIDEAVLRAYAAWMAAQERAVRKYEPLYDGIDWSASK